MMRSGVLRRLFQALCLCSLVLVSAAAPFVSADESDTEPQPNTPIEHFIYLMQENHSFDNYFGTYPGADGIPPNTCMPEDPTDPNNTKCIEPFHLGTRPVEDLDHNLITHERQFRDGKMDGFAYAFRQEGKDGELTMGHYDDRDLPFYWNIADEYVLFDRFFTSAKGGSVRNHMFWVAGQAGVKDPRKDAIPEEGWGDLPTIFDRLQEQGVSWKFYVQNYDPKITFRDRGTGDKSAQVVWVPLLAYARYLDDPEFSSRIANLDEYYDDLANDELPAVSFIVPSGASEHPPGSILAGQRFVKGLINALMQSEAWESSAFLWTYDDWGGWYDHVPPPIVDDWGYGFRAPALLVSPYAKRGHVDSTELDFTSGLKFIEENYDLEPLAERDAKANNFLSAFDFTQPPREPRIVPSTRDEPEMRIPWRPGLYGAYSAAILLPTFIIGWALIDPRARSRQLAPGTPSLRERAGARLGEWRTRFASRLQRRGKR
jgi:phospholipase C